MGRIHLFQALSKCFDINIVFIVTDYGEMYTHTFLNYRKASQLKCLSQVLRFFKKLFTHKYILGLVIICRYIGKGIWGNKWGIHN